MAALGIHHPITNPRGRRFATALTVAIVWLSASSTIAGAATSEGTAEGTICVGTNHGCYATSTALSRWSPEARLLALRGRALSARLGTIATAFRNPIAPEVTVGSGPTDVAVDQDNHTAYVSNGNDNAVSLVNTSRCKAGNTAGCDQIAPTVAVGIAPVADVYDRQEHTVYVIDTGDNKVSMIDSATCNATAVSGCSHMPTVTVGANPDFAAVDPATRTIYVVNAGANSVSLLNAATCNAAVTSGCGHISTVAVGIAPTAVGIDDATHTAYVANGFGLATPGTISMINEATCNATVTSGCSRTPRTAPASVGASWVAVDPSTHTVYVASGPTGPLTNRGFVDVINADKCNATVTSGCRRTPLAITVGSVPIGAVVDQTTDSVFVSNEEDSSISVIDGSTCNGGFTGGCNQRPPTVSVGFNPGTPAIDLSTDTIYAPSMYENSVSVIDGAACTLTHQSGCREAAPTSTIGNAPAGSAVNQATDTVYVSNRSDNDLSVINGDTCNAGNRSGCGRSWPTVASGPWPQAVAVDTRTDTIYTANVGVNFGGGHTVSVIDGATCNATNHSGCGAPPATVYVGNRPIALAINEATDTIYVANALDNTVSVINGATCNGTDHSGCGLTPPSVSTGGGPDGVAVDQKTDTVYVANGNDNDVSVIDGATCNGTHHSGCGQTAPTTPTAGSGNYLAVDNTTDTVYVANYPNSISVIDGATCNATTTSGCGQVAPIMVTGGAPFGVAVDEATDTLFVDSTFNSDAEAYDGATCNASTATGCNQQPVIVPTGGYPGQIGVNQATRTVYIPDNVDGEVSFFGFDHGVAFR